MRILIVGPINSVFIQQLVGNLLKAQPSWRIDIFSIQKAEKENNELLFGKVYYCEIAQKSPFYPLKNIYNIRESFKHIRGKYDVINIHFNRYLYIGITSRLKALGKKVIITYWGSDFMRIGKIEKLLLRHINKSASFFSVTSIDSIKILENEFKIKKKILTVSFGLEALESIKNWSFKDKKNLRTSLGLGSAFPIITVGYNGDPAQQHLNVIEEINNIVKELPSSYLIVLPFTYKKNINYRMKVEDVLKKYKLNYLFLDSFLSNIEVAQHRFSSDIFIHYQISDQASGSVLESLASYNVVINGSWLKYSFLKNNNVFYLEANDISLRDKLLIALKIDASSDSRIRNNREYILNNNTWENSIKKWIKMYES